MLQHFRYVCLMTLALFSLCVISIIYVKIKFTKPIEVGYQSQDVITSHVFASSTVMSHNLTSTHAKQQLLQRLPHQSGQACVHPKLVLWHPALTPYFKDVPPLECSDVEENWIDSVNGTFKFSDKMQKKHGKMFCEYTPYVRGNNDFTVLTGNLIKPILDGDPIPSDFGEVKCASKSGKSYKNILSGIHRKEKLKLLKVNLPQVATGLNVLMFGFDSTSRMTWMRNLPKTHDYFTNILGGIVLEGYNIVGDGTPQALLPILTGMTEPELPEARRGFAGATTVDGHPWLWKQLTSMGYITQWGEDGASCGTFTYRMLGFKNQPVDHYMRPFYLKSEPQYGLHKPFCLGSVPRHLTMLNYVKDFFKVYTDKPKFSFLFHSEFTHGGYSKVRVVDQDLMDTLQFLQDNSYLENTVLILMSDHGARFQEVRQTVQGKYEERMPYFSFRFPPSFIKQHPESIKNLKANVHKLTTPFDIHATFQDILNFSTTNRKGDISQRGISLLKEIPMERSCSDAGIEAHWCACLHWQDIPTTKPSVLEAALKLVSTINDIVQTSPYNELCAKFNLLNITSAGMYAANDNLLKFKQSQDIHGRIPDLSDNMDDPDILYQVSIETVPGGGRFEGTVKHILKDGVYIVNAHEISRINKYGSQPHCVQDQAPHLRPYCYCKTQLKDN